MTPKPANQDLHDDHVQRKTKKKQLYSAKLFISLSCHFMDESNVNITDYIGTIVIQMKQDVNKFMIGE